jgi:hypothetical protein
VEGRTVSYSAALEIPIYGAGVFSLLHWYAPAVAAGATEFSAMTGVLLVALVVGVALLRDVVPAVVGA